MVEPFVPAQASYLAQLINAKSESAYAFSAEGGLQKTGKSNGSKGRSKEYSKQLDRAIASENKVILLVAKEFQGKPVDGGDTGPDTTGATQNALSVISGEPSPAPGLKVPDSPASVLVHELVGHSIPYVMGDKMQNAIENDNKVRAQTGDQLRPADSNHCSTCKKN